MQVTIKLLDKVSNKFLIKTKEKIRSKAYEILTIRRGEKDLKIAKKWERNYGLTPNKNLIERTIKEVIRMKIKQRTKERLLRHLHQSFIKINSLRKLKLIDDNGKCNECQKEYDEFEHILYDCPISLYIWNVTLNHINNIYEINITPSLVNIIIPNTETLKDKKLEEREKEEITTLISQTLSELHSRLYKGEKILTQNSQEEAIKIVNRSIREVINHNNRTKIVKITNSNFPNKTKTLKEFFNESQYNVSCNWINKEIATNDYYEIHSHDEGKTSKTKLGGNQI